MKRVLVVLGAATMLAIFVGASICQRILVINCEYAFADFKTDWRVLDFDLKAGIQIKNPNEVDVIIDKISMDFYINETNVAAGTPTFGDTIPPDATDTIYIPMTISYADVLGELVDAIKGDSAAYKLVGTIYFETRVDEHKYPITITQGAI
ncbi:LEA type 2 family protein [candidate division WOR-3 bacterium]|nr:LEA type 2 family protein [candidate division WOR-3 bacterium]